MAENFPNLVTDTTYTQILRCTENPNTINPYEICAHITVKLIKTKNKEKNLKVDRTKVINCLWGITV